MLAVSNINIHAIIKLLSGIMSKCANIHQSLYMSKMECEPTGPQVEDQDLFWYTNQLITLIMLTDYPAVL